MPQETIISKILSGLKRRGRKPQSRRKKIRLPFSGKMKAIASKLINSRIPDIEKLAPVEEQQITKPSFGVVAKDNPEYVVPAVKPKTNPKHIISATKPKTNPKHIISATKPRSNSEYTIPDVNYDIKKTLENPQFQPSKQEKRNYPTGNIFSKAFSRFEILMKKLNKSGKRFIPISRDDVNVLTKIIPAFKTGGMVTDPTPAVLGEGGPEKAKVLNMTGPMKASPEEKARMEAALQRAKPQARMYSTAGMKEALEENERMRPLDIKRKQKSVKRLTKRLSGLKNALKSTLENRGNFSKRTQESRLRNIKKRIEETESKLEQEKFELEELTRTDSPSGIGADATEIREDVNPYADRDRSKISARHMLDMSPEDFKEKVVDKNPIMQLGIERMAKNATRLNPSDDEKIYSPEDLKQESKPPVSDEIDSPQTPKLPKLAGMIGFTNTPKSPVSNEIDSPQTPTLSTGGVSRNVPEQTVPSMLNSKNDSPQSSKSSVSRSSKSPVSYEGLSGIELLKAGIENEGEDAPEFSGKLDFSPTPKSDELQRTKPSIGNTPSTQGSSTSTSYKGLSGIELLKAGIENEGDGGGLSIEPAMETSKIQEQVNEKMTTQKNNETMIKETMTRVDEKVGKAVSEGPQFIPIQTGNTSRTQKSGGSAQIISGDSSFKVASKDNMSHPIWRTRLG